MKTDFKNDPDQEYGSTRFELTPAQRALMMATRRVVEACRRVSAWCGGEPPTTAPRIVGA